MSTMVFAPIAIMGEAVLAFLIIYVYFRRRLRHQIDLFYGQFQPAFDTDFRLTELDYSFTRMSSGENFVLKMKAAKKSMLIFYGSQTGTAEGFAQRLGNDATRYGINALVMDPEGCAFDALTELRSIPNALLVYCVATYSEGDPTDNAQELFEWLQHAPGGGFDLSGVSYAVFGLGNKTYENFNAAGKLADKQMESLRARRICELGLGDDDANIEDDFVIWCEIFWTAVCYKFRISPEIVGKNGEQNKFSRQYRLINYDEQWKEAEIFSGESSRLGSFTEQTPPYGPKNPYLGTIVAKRELHKAGDRSCLHMEVKIGSNYMQYEPGDHIGIFPQNDQDLVNAIAKRLGVNLERVFSLENLDQEAVKRNPFPCPTTYGVALTHYLDVTSPLRTNVLRELAEYTDDETEKSFLRLLSSPSIEGRAKYGEWVHQCRRDLLAVLEDLPSLKPPIEFICELLPRLQPRYYSIASSPKLHPTAVHLTAVVVEYVTKTGRKARGVCTNFLRRTEIGEKIPVFIRRSQFRLPHRPSAPVIMIGPGTGVAPFRGFIQDRWNLRKDGKTVGQTVLYFGCRHRNEDYLYEEELGIWRSEGTLTQLHVAFSREKATKTYVQHLIRQNAAEIWRLINGDRAHIYVCGDARQMAPDVYATLLDICCEEGKLDACSALDYMKRLSSQGRYSADVWS